ncbi:MAG: acyl carrier protein [Actinomycetota bacterium]
MERTEVFEAIRSVAGEVLGVDPSGIVETARFKEDLEADSLHLVELVMGLEDHFAIEVPEDDLDEVLTVGQAVDLVLARLT